VGGDFDRPLTTVCCGRRPPALLRSLTETCRCTWDPSSFTATAIYTGENRLIRVRGTGECPTGGITAELVEGNAGINPDPSELVLDLHETAPDIGPDVLSPIEVDRAFEVDFGVHYVVIRALDLRISVQEPA
jgi:hypothetical protein